MNNITKIVASLCIVLILTTNNASASILDDADAWIDNGIKNVLSNLKKLSVSDVGVVTVSCNDGSTTCTYAGEDWHISTNIISSNQNLYIVLPKGTEWTDAITKTKATSGSEVEFLIKPDRAEIKKDVRAFTITYRTCWLGSICSSPRQIPGYEPSGASSYKKIYYSVDMTSGGYTYTKYLTSDYANQQSFFIVDNKGNQARLQPNYVIDTGYNLELSNIIYLDNGYGVYRPYTYGSFINARNIVENRMNYEVAGLPQNWREYVDAMKKANLVEVSDLGQPIIDNQKVTIIYPSGIVGINGEILIPKAMASTVTVRLDEGKPRITKVDKSPSEWTIGHGKLTLTIFVTNDGSDDWIQLGIDQKVGTTNYVSNRKWIRAGQSDYFAVEIIPTVNTEQYMTFVITATGSGSGYQDTETVIVRAINPPQDCGLFGCTEKKQKVKVTAYSPNKAVISAAPIFVGGEQKSNNGYWEGDLTYGEWVISTNNNSNPKLIAPTPVTINLQGGEPKVISLYFSDSSLMGDDYTWIFWLVIIIIIVLFAWYSGFAKAIIANPYLIIPIVLLIVILWLLWVVLQAVLAVAEVGQNVWDFVTTLGGILK